jgi:hypothetical protein
MRATKLSYAEDYSDYRTGDFCHQQGGSATAYYRKSDALYAARHYGHKSDTLPALDSHWADGMLFADFIRGTVQPYRITR